MSSLFTITHERRMLMFRIEENDGEVTDDMAEELAFNRSDFKDKSEAYGYMIKSVEDEIAAAEREVARINLLLASKRKLKDRLELTLLEALKQFGEAKKTEGGQTTWSAESGLFKFRTGVSQSVEILDEKSIPKRYMVQPPRPPRPPAAPSKNTIKNDLKMGLVVKGAELKTNYSLKIK